MAVLETSRGASPDGRAAAAARIDRLFLIAFIPAGLYLAVSFYIRLTSHPHPYWTEFATALFFALLGLRSLVRPMPPESRGSSRALGALLIAAGAALALFAIFDS